MTDDELTYEIRNAMFEVQKELGPGLLESVYEEALLMELHNRGLKAESQIEIPVYYKGKLLKQSFRLDLIVEDRIIIELKSVANLEKVHFKQIMNYLRLKDLHVGLLVNFNSDSLDRENFHRIYNSRATHKY